MSVNSVRRRPIRTKFPHPLSLNYKVYLRYTLYEFAKQIHSSDTFGVGL